MCNVIDALDHPHMRYVWRDAWIDDIVHQGIIFVTQSVLVHCQFAALAFSGLLMISNHAFDARYSYCM